MSPEEDHRPKDPDLLLELDRLALAFPSADGRREVLRGVSFGVRRGEVLALVGESGCGKSLTGLSILGLHPAGSELRGAVRLAGAGDLVGAAPEVWQDVRGKRVAMVFQEPASALNPVLTIGFQLRQVLVLRRGLSRRDARRTARELLERVAMPDPERRLGSYPHELSGGQLQRAMIALALAAGPELLIADEPTTALDTTVQAQVLDLIRDLRRDFGLTVLLVTHDLGIVAQSSDRVVVMYAGEVVEEAEVEAFFRHPFHPYSQALLAAVPRLDAEAASGGIPGRPPEPGELPSGCVFHPRCHEAFDLCRRRSPDLTAREDRSVRCFLYQDEEGPP